MLALSGASQELSFDPRAMPQPGASNLPLRSVASATDWRKSELFRSIVHGADQLTASTAPTLSHGSALVVIFKGAEAKTGIGKSPRADFNFTGEEAENVSVAWPERSGVPEVRTQSPSRRKP